MATVWDLTSPLGFPSFVLTGDAVAGGVAGIEAHLKDASVIGELVEEDFHVFHIVVPGVVIEARAARESGPPNAQLRGFRAAQGPGGSAGDRMAPGETAGFSESEGALFAAFILSRRLLLLVLCFSPVVKVIRGEVSGAGDGSDAVVAAVPAGGRREPVSAEAEIVGPAGNRDEVLGG